MSGSVPVLLAIAAVIVLATGDGTALGAGSPEVLKAADFAIGSYNQDHSHAYAFKILEVQSATAQILPPARVKYTLTVTVGETVCKNQAHLDLTRCSLQNSLDAKTMTCDFVVLAVPNSDLPSYLLRDQCS